MLRKREPKGMINWAFKKFVYKHKAINLEMKLKIGTFYQQATHNAMETGITLC